MQTETKTTTPGLNLQCKTTNNISCTYILSNFTEFQVGCFQVRINNPFIHLNRLGHKMEYVVMGQHEYTEIDSDIVMYSRAYTQDPFRSLWKHKSDGRKIVYEMDDDIWNIPELNPAHDGYGKKMKSDISGLCKEADLVIVSTEALKEVVIEETGQKNIVVIPNALDLDKFKLRPNKEGLRIGWTGGANHYEDLDIVLQAIHDLQEEYDFEFIIQGLTAGPWDADAYSTNLILERGEPKEAMLAMNTQKLNIYKKLRKLKNFKHIPFYPPEMYASVLKEIDLDIGLIPIVGHKFDKSKSIIKYLEYTATGTAVIASEEDPYKDVIYTVKNKYKYWYNGIKELIENKELRNQLAKQQHKQLFPKYDMKEVVKQYEKALCGLIK